MSLQLNKQNTNKTNQTKNKTKEITAEVSLVVYDEVHYLRDPERGVVWEESLVLMPKQARLAFLSATLPNSAEFAAWVAATHGAPVHVVYTEYRPTPLQHYIFPSGAAGLYMVVDERGAFREDNFQQAVAALADAQADVHAGCVFIFSLLLVSCLCLIHACLSYPKTLSSTLKTKKQKQLGAVQEGGGAPRDRRPPRQRRAARLGRDARARRGGGRAERLRRRQPRVC